VFSFDLLAVFILIADGNLAGQGVNYQICRLREYRPFLNVVIMDESKALSLGEYSRFVVHRTIPKAKHKTRYRPISVNGLGEISFGKNFAFL